jgi:serine/threonine protein kinase
MSELESLLEAFLRGEADLHAIEAAMDARLARAPESAPEIALLLDTAHRGGLGDAAYAVLREKLEGADTTHGVSGATTTNVGATTSPAPTARPGTDDPDFRPFDTGYMLQSHDEYDYEKSRDRQDSRGEVTTTGGFPRTGAEGSREFGQGDRLRNRFELLSKLGEGGMGAVWKGKDLLKEEAKDRNPYVAIKLLQKNFKEHPDAFVALQRETAKQQRLAHPNVATVFSFDRDTDSGAVFMTMDLLEGESLDSHIINMPEGGLSEQEAMDIIEQLAAGLGYAHSNGLVHSDLKPGNCFLTRDGTVKLLDFGIARASTTMLDAEGVTTLFDPGELGAITPAYATVEMFEGQEPDPRDDIYALGIMAYQLLTGEHPYGKLSAPRAAEQGLVPEPIAKLSKGQNKGLARALALERSLRTSSVDEFLDDIRRKNNLRLYGVAASVIAVVLIAGLGYAQITDYLRDQENEAIISILEQGGVDNIAKGLSLIRALDSENQRQDVLGNQRTLDAVVQHITEGGPHRIREGLSLIKPFDTEWQQDIRGNDRARHAIIEYYKQRIDEAFMPSKGLFNYPKARKEMDLLAEIYPNSATVSTRRAELEADRQKALDELTDRYDTLREDLARIPQFTGDGLAEVLRALRQLDPQNAMLNDRRLPATLARQTQIAVDAGDYARAEALMVVAAELTPDDPTLAKMRHDLETRIEDIRKERLASELHDRLQDSRNSLNTVADFRRMQDDLVVLASLRPNDSMLNDLRWQLQQIFSSEFDELLAEAQWEQAEALLVDFARFFSIPFVATQRGRLEEALKASDTKIPASPSRQLKLSERATTLNNGLKKPLLTPEWEAEFETAYKESLAMVGTKSPGLQLVRKTMVLLYRDRAMKALEAGRYVDARDYIAKGRSYERAAPELDAAEQALLAAQQNVLREREGQRQVARIAELKAALLDHAAAHRAEEAAGLLMILREQSPSDDPFVADEAPLVVALAYLHSAEQSWADGDLDGAVERLERGLALAPGTAALEAALLEYRNERERGRLETALATAVATGAAMDPDQVRADLAEHEKRYPDDHAEFTAGLLGTASAALVSRASDSPLDGVRLRGDLAAMEAIFPDAGESMRADLSAAMGAQAETLADSNPYAAHEYVAAALVALPGQRELERLATRLPPRNIARTRSLLESGRLNGARAALRTASKSHPKHPDLPRLEAAINARALQAVFVYDDYAEKVRKRVLSKASERNAAYAQVKRLWSDNPSLERIEYKPPRPGECDAKLAGKGRSSDGVCFDLVAERAKGVPLVVVPAGGGVNKPFAIGKYEVSVAQYNRYCEMNARCQPVTGQAQHLPVTGITREAAEELAAWLSAEASNSSGTKVVYRLPTEREWRHAANAAGRQVTKGINCRPAGKMNPTESVLTARNGDVFVGLPVGRSLMGVTFGEENGWGMVNSVGNAQEWVTTPDGLGAQGGAYSDRQTRCVVAFSRGHDGAPDGHTGFRLLRELD